MHDLPQGPASVDSGLLIGWHTHRCWLWFPSVAILLCSVLASLSNPDLGTNLVLELLILGSACTVKDSHLVEGFLGLVDAELLNTWWNLTQ